MNAPWRIELFGGLRAQQGDRVITRFRTQKTGTLLAYLAYYRDRKHPREVLIELLWPKGIPKAGRASLRVAISSLRRQLEPPGVPHGAVLIADRHSVGLNPAAVTTDVADFEAALQAAAQARGATERAQFLTDALELYRGELLLGHYEDWVLPEQHRLEEAFFQALCQLIAHCEGAGEVNRALDYARRGVSADPLREEAHYELMRLYAAIGQPSAALQQFRELEHLLKKELGVTPSAAARELAREISAQVSEVSGQLVVLSGGRSVISRKPAGSRRQKAGRKPPKVGSQPSTTSHPSPALLLQFPTASPHPSARIPPPSPVGSLPLQFTRFFGREGEMAQLQQMLLSPDTRLTTLTGPGGSGKTRLAIEVAEKLRDDFKGGAWFVPLADLSDARSIVDAVRDVLRLPRSTSVEPLEQVVAALSQQPSLLVLDNFEHLAAGGAPVVLTLMKRVPSLTLLVTSRQRLALAGEREFPVLPLPTPEGADTPERLSQGTSVQLFVDRAQGARPDFQVTARNAPAVAGLCQRLEGLPLALELAAARAQVLTPAQILNRLSQRFELLTSRRADKNGRHHSLWAALDWSYHLLPPPLRRFFARLSVFRGGWALEAAEAVCEEPLALDYLAQLRAHSLVLVEEGAPDVRCRLLETLREFAAEQLAPDEKVALAQRHAHYYLALAEESEPQLTGPEQEVWFERLETDHDNLRAVLAWAAEGHAATGLRLARALGQFWEVRGYWMEGGEWLEQLLARGPEVSPDVQADGFVMAGRLMLSQGDYERATALLKESLRLSRHLGHIPGVAQALYNLGRATFYRGDYAGVYAHYEESLSLQRTLHDKRGVASTLHALGLAAIHRGDYAQACAFSEESLAIWKTLGNKRGIATSFMNLGNAAFSQGAYQKARAFFEQGLAIYQELGDRAGIANVLQGLGRLVFAQGDPGQARALFEESLSMRRALGEKRGIANVLTCLGQVAHAEGDLVTARAFLEESLTMQRELKERREMAIALYYLGDVAHAEGDTAQARALYEEGFAAFRDLGIKPTLPYGLEGLAGLACAQGQWERAARLFGAADALRESLAIPFPPHKKSDRDKHLNTLRQTLGESVFTAAWDAGRALTCEQAVAEALNEKSS